MCLKTTPETDFSDWNSHTQISELRPESVNIFFNIFLILYFYICMALIQFE